jgi:hypothetical protein
MGTANAQGGMTCGNLHFRVIPDAGRKISTSGEWYSFEVLLRANEGERPLLPGRWGSVPRATCVGGSALAIAYFLVNGDPVVELVFQNGDDVSSFLSQDEYAVQGHAIILPARPRLPDEVRERIPVEYRDLFDYGPLKGKFG